MARELLRALVAVAVLAVLAARASAESPLPETQLPLRLIGTVVAAESGRSIAVIENGGATAVVRTGDAIGGARVEEIRKDEVVLTSSGRLERLAFSAFATASRGGSGSAAGSAAAGGQQATAAREAKDRDWPDASNAGRASARALARAPMPNPVPASAAAQDEDDAAAKPPLTTEQLLVNLSSQARYAPLLDQDGKLHGVALMDIRQDSTLERIGLQSGDVVVSVGGVQVDNTTKAFDALRALDPRAGGEVLVERKGVPTVITVPPGSL